MTEPRIRNYPAVEREDLIELHETSIEQIMPSSLMVSVDYLDLVESVGESEAWVVLGKLKDLLG